MSNNLNKVNMSLDDIINNQRRNKRNLQVVKSNKSERPINFNRKNGENNIRRRNFNRRDLGRNERDFERGFKRDPERRTRGRFRRNDNLNRRTYNRYNNFDNNRANNQRGRLRDRLRRRNLPELKNTNTSNYRRIFVSNLHKDLINSELKNIFSRVGQLKRCGIHWDELGNSRGTADVEYMNPEDARRAIEEFNNAEIDGLPMKVSFSTSAGPTRRRVFKRRLGGRGRPNIGGGRGKPRNMRNIDRRDQRNDRN